MADANPYSSPKCGRNIDSSESSHSTYKDGAPMKPSLRTFMGSVAFVMLCLLAQYAVLAWYVIVHVLPYTGSAGDYDWLMLFMPIVAFIALLGLSKIRGRKQRLRGAVAATVAGTAFAIPIIVVFGLWFHFAMGGAI